MRKVILWVVVGFVALTTLLTLSCFEEESKYLYIIVSDGGIPAYYMQEDNTWCGAACIEMYARFNNPYFSKTQAEIMFLADREYPFGLLSEYEVCAFMNNYIAANGFAVYISQAATFLWNTRQSIDANQPFICGMYDNHWVFVTGYRVPRSNISDLQGIIYADPAKMCNSDSSSCYGAFYDMASSVFLNFTGTPVVYVAVFNPPLMKEMFPPVVDSSAYPPYVYANYYNFKAAKGVPGPGDSNIPFADGNNGIPNPLEGRIIQAAESTLAVWGADQLIGLDPEYASQFDGAYPASVELVTNMAYLRFGGPETFPCPINCGGQTFWVVTYASSAGYYYVGSVRVKLTDDSTTFESGGIAGFISTGSAKANQPGQSSGANKLATVSAGFLTRKELHRMFPDCTFFPFWDLNELTATPFLPFWYVQRPDGSRFILNSWGQEMVRDANNGVLLLKGSGQTKQGSIPNKMSLSQNYPNPFNPETQINFAVPNFAPVKIEIFNVLGQRIKTLVNGEYQAGNYRVTWDGTNQNGEKVSSGIYLYRLQVGAETVSKKMILTK